MLVSGMLGNACCFPTCLGDKGGPANSGPANIKSIPITRQTGAAWDGDHVVNATWLIKCPLVPSFPLHGTIVWTYAGSGQGWADDASLWQLCTFKDEYSETMLWCLRAWLFKVSAVWASKLGAPLDFQLVRNLGFVYSFLTPDMPAWLSFCPAIALALSRQRVSGSPYTDYMSFFLTDIGSAHEPCLPITLDYYKWCYLNTMCHCQ